MNFLLNKSLLTSAISSLKDSLSLIWKSGHSIAIIFNTTLLSDLIREWRTEEYLE